MAPQRLTLTVKPTADLVELVDRFQASNVEALQRAAELVAAVSVLEPFAPPAMSPLTIPRDRVDAVLEAARRLATVLEPFAVADQDAGPELATVRLDAADPLADDPALDELERAARANARTLLRAARSAGRVHIAIDAERTAARRLDELGLGRYVDERRAFVAPEENTRRYAAAIRVGAVEPWVHAPGTAAELARRSAGVAEDELATLPSGDTAELPDGRLALQRRLELELLRDAWLEHAESLEARDRSELDVEDVPHLAADAPPLARCDSCHRATWAPSDVGELCNLPQPDGASCAGRFRPIGAEAPAS
jgi:hypothetical protein